MNCNILTLKAILFNSIKKLYLLVILIANKNCYVGIFIVAVMYFFSDTV